MANFGPKNFGFGCMRLPMIDTKVDIEQFKKMTDTFIENGFTYFDTAHGYIETQSETAIKEALTSRYPRDKYLLTNKLTSNYFEKEEDIVPFFESQLKACGVEYFDNYLMHAQSHKNYGHFQECHAYEVASQLKKEGKIKHLGISFHDTAEVLEKILTDHPEVEMVQIQFNYLDYGSPEIQSKKVYDVCRKFNKQVIIMEPVKGGNLINLPDEAKKIFDDLHGGSYASYAIRFAASFEGVEMVLSGMSDLGQMEDNLSFMKDFKKINKDEEAAIEKVTNIIKDLNAIACTACRYCVDGCPMNIKIPDLFSDMNAKTVYKDWNSDSYYEMHTSNGQGKASECIKCKQCEQVCPQQLPITDLLEKVAQAFEKKEEQ